MDILVPAINLDTFFQQVRSAPERLLLLDYDGTLAPFVNERDRAVPYPGVRECLKKIMDTRATRLAIISGRWSRDLAPLLELDPLPEIWGCHGAERVRQGQEPELTGLDEVTVRGLARADDWAEREGLMRLAERKPTSLAFHWRGLDEKRAAGIQKKIRRRWAPIARKYGLLLHRFDGGLELRADNISKANAVRTLLGEAGEDAIIAYCGDDLTDEDAFAALGERGLKVLVRSEARPTAADIRLKPPEELLDFLGRWLEAIS